MNEQRGWKGQPGGASNGCTGLPGMTGSRSSGSSIRGRAASSADVYGCSGRANSSLVGCRSTIRPAYMTSTRSQSARGEIEVMRDEDHPEPALAPKLREDADDLALDGHVERGRRPSAMIRSGSSAIAAAIITRCSIPPESWCG